MVTVHHGVNEFLGQEVPQIEARGIGSLEGMDPPKRYCIKECKSLLEELGPLGDGRTIPRNCLVLSRIEISLRDYRAK